MKSEQELFEIAEGIYRGEIFTDRQIPPSDYVILCPSIFMSLSFIKPEDAQKLSDKKVNMVYAYMKDAAPRSMNGYPMFLSAHFLNEDESKIVVEKHKQIIESMKKLKEVVK